MRVPSPLPFHLPPHPITPFSPPLLFISTDLILDIGAFTLERAIATDPLFLGITPSAEAGEVRFVSSIAPRFVAMLTVTR